MNTLGGFLCLYLVKLIGNRNSLCLGYGILSVLLVACGALCRSENMNIKYISLLLVNLFTFTVSATLRGTRAYGAAVLDDKGIYVAALSA